MAIDSNKKKAEQLGMPYGTAAARLRKLILFDILQFYGDNICFQCGKEIENADELSIEHKIPWLDNSVELFWDLDNISFSHLSCNVSAAKRAPSKAPHGKVQRYKLGCRCDLCKEANARRVRHWRSNNALVAQLENASSP